MFSVHINSVCDCFQLNLFTNIVIVSFVSSIINILMCIMNAAVFYVLHRKQTDTPFTILVSWKRKGHGQDAQHAMMLEKVTKRKNDGLDPFCRCGHRKYLSFLLTRCASNDGSLKCQVAASKKLESGCMLFGVFVSDPSAEAGAVSNFMRTQKQKIHDEVMKAFGFHPKYSDEFDFKVVMRSTISSGAARARLASDTLRDFDVPKALRTQVQEHLDEALGRDDGAPVKNTISLSLSRENDFFSL